MTQPPFNIVRSLKDMRRPPTGREKLRDLPVRELESACVNAEKHAGPDSDPAKMCRRARATAEARERG